MTRRTFNTLAPAGIAAAAFTQTGCQSALDWLELAVGALEAALPLVAPAAGVDPATIASVNTYLAATSQAIGEASSILAGSGTDAQKATAIVAAFAGIAAPVVPAQYSALVAAVVLVAKYVAQFLAKLPAPTTPASVTHPASTADKAKLQTIQQRAVAVHKAVIR